MSRQASKSDALGVLADPPFGFAVGGRHMLGYGYRAKLAVGCRIDLDRQPARYLTRHGSPSVLVPVKALRDGSSLYHTKSRLRQVLVR